VGRFVEAKSLLLGAASISELSVPLSVQQWFRLHTYKKLQNYSHSSSCCVCNQLLVRTARCNFNRCPP